MEGRLILWLAFTSVMWQGVGSNSWPLYLLSDALATALSRPVSVRIMSDCKSCVLFLSKKKRQERIRDMFFPQKFGWFWQFMPPLQRIWRGILCLHCSLFRSCCSQSTGDWNICVCVCVLGGGGKDIKNLIYKYLHIYVLSFTPYKTI